MGKYSHYAQGDPEIQGILDAIAANRKLVLDRHIIRKEVNGAVDMGNESLNCESFPCSKTSMVESVRQGIMSSKEN